MDENKNDDALDSLGKEELFVTGEEADLTEVAIADFTENQVVPLAWVKAQNIKSISNMYHMMLLSSLQEDRFSAERQHFYNEVHKHVGQEITSVAEANHYISRLMNSHESDSLLRNAAPGAVAATDKYVSNIDIDSSFMAAGYGSNRVTPEFRENMQVTQAYAEKFGGDAGRKSFMDTLKEQKDNYLKGMGDPRVGLAISGTMLSMAVMAGTGPAGLVIGSIKVAQSLLETDKGKEFQKALYSSSTSFLSTMGVKPEIIEAVTSSMESLWSNTVGSRWGKLAMIGMGVAAISLSLSASEIPINIDSIVNDVTSKLPSAAEVPAMSQDLSDLASKGVDNASNITQNLTDQVSQVLDKTPDAPSAAVDIAPQQLVTDLYDIKAGDTLWDIAKDAYSQANPGEIATETQLINMVNEIAEHNQIDDPNMIFAGQTLHMPQNMMPSMDEITGPTHWIKPHDASVDDPLGHFIEGLDGFEGRVDGWRNDNEPSDANENVGLPSKPLRV